MPSSSATIAASSRLSAEVWRDESRTPTTFSGPSASLAIAAVRAESTPPESPTSDFLETLFADVVMGREHDRRVYLRRTVQRLARRGVSAGLVAPAFDPLNGTSLTMSSSRSAPSAS